MPHVIVIAGPNGAGKTTAAPALLGKALRLYQPLADSWQMYNNTNICNLVPIASKIGSHLEVKDPIIWQNLVEMYDETTKK